jgi:hypothetical protein
MKLRILCPFTKLHFLLINRKSRTTLIPGNPAISLRPVAFRPRLATGLAFY